MTSRFSYAFAFTALIVGLVAGASMNFNDAEAQAVDTEQPAPTVTVAEAPKTAYLDFLKVLKGFSPLRRDQAKITQKLDSKLDKWDKYYRPKIEKASKAMAQYDPETRHYRDAMKTKLGLLHKFNKAQLIAQQDARADMRDSGIRWFGILKKDAATVAKRKDYSQILNVVGNSNDIAAVEDFQALQQQLLLSPVLYYDKTHDITEEVEAFVTEKWALHITFAKDNEVEVLDTDGKAIAKSGDDDKEADYTVPFGTKLKIKVNVLKKDEPATGEDAEVGFYKRGIGSGDIDRDGNYTAPSEFPRNTDVIEIRISSKMDPRVTKIIKLRIVDKDGKRKPVEEPEDKPEEE